MKKVFLGDNTDDIPSKALRCAFMRGDKQCDGIRRDGYSYCLPCMNEIEAFVMCDKCKKVTVVKLVETAKPIPGYHRMFYSLVDRFKGRWCSDCMPRVAEISQELEDFIVPRLKELGVMPQDPDPYDPAH